MDILDSLIVELTESGEYVNQFCTELTRFYIDLEERLIRAGAFFSIQIVIKDDRVHGVVSLIWGKFDGKWRIVVKGNEAKPLVQSSRHNKLVAFSHVIRLVQGIASEGRILRALVDNVKEEREEFNDYFA